MKGKKKKGIEGFESSSHSSNHIFSASQADPMRFDDNMDDRQSIGGGSANSSSDFVSHFACPPPENGNLLTPVQVRKLYKYIHLWETIPSSMSIMLMIREECWRIHRTLKSYGGATMAEAL